MDFGGQIEIPRQIYDIIDHNKFPSSEKSAEKCILRNSYFHHSEPKYIQYILGLFLSVCLNLFSIKR